MILNCDLMCDFATGKMHDNIILKPSDRKLTAKLLKTFFKETIHYLTELIFTIQ